MAQAEGAIRSYLKHQAEERASAEKDDFPWCYTSPGSIGNRHHLRMLMSIMPLLRHCQNTTWMTVGDGRFGSDAHFLRPHVRLAVATSISGSTLRIAEQRGWIDAYSEENAEAISFPNDHFDFVLCKESYHHFPRPALGFYEMLRVARHGLVLIEPMDGVWSPLLGMKQRVKRILRREHDYDQFEPSGNFVFRLNIAETAKMLTAVGAAALACKGINTFWHAPFDTADAEGLAWPSIASRLAVGAQDLACWLGLLSPGLASVICFRRAPAEALLRDLRAAGFYVRILPKNPYA